MKIKIRVKLKSKEEKIEKIDEENFVAYVREIPVEGRANKRLLELISEYFNVSKSDVRIISGVKSRSKTLEIKNESCNRYR
ncbi:MAG: DUF167 domain-containing protein [Candidatus Omnitrophica bacterium]|nr:DUF167 domain-containing protein [Candidatus Omnitrophota bacterium]